MARTIMLSVLLVTISILNMTNCRRLIDEIDNEINVGTGVGNIGGGGGGGGNSRQSLNYREPIEWVKISSPPKPVISKMIGSNVELECEAMGSPVPSVRWLKGRTPLTENQSYETNIISENPSQSIAKVRSRVVINFLLPIHSGRFTCVAESGSQIATSDTTIYVVKKDFEQNFTQLVSSKILGAYYLPRITLWSTTYMDEIGANIVLPCQAIGNPKPTLTWFDPQGQIINNNHHGGRVTILPDGELSIRSLTWADMGEYNCVVQNKLGQDSIETFLYPMKPVHEVK